MFLDIVQFWEDFGC